MKINSTWQIIIAMILGIFSGLFFGELNKYLFYIGQAFIMLMEMPVLLFLFSSIVIGISSLTFRNAQKIFLYSFLFLIASWLITQVTILVLPLGFPPLKIATKYSSIEIAPLQSSLLDYFIPQNPFKSFADGTLPAIVIFSIFFAVALLYIKNKQSFIKNCIVIQKTSLIMFDWINKFAPIGVFALVASAAGIRTLLDLQQLQYYYYSFIFTSIMISLVILPLFSIIFLPFSYKDIIKPIIPSLIIAFVSSNVLITIPFIIKAIDKKMFEYDFVKNQSYGLSNILVPLSYNFPISGKLINLLFIMFVAWHYNIHLTSSQALEMSLLGILTSFGSSSGAISFLLDALEMPKDAIDIFITSALITSRFSSMATVASITTLCFFSISSFERKLTFNYKKFFIALVALIIIYFSWFAFMSLIKKPIIMQKETFMDLSIDKPLASNSYKFLRVGYIPNNQPFSYINHKQELVGFDIQTAYDLAFELKQEPVFISLLPKDIISALENDQVDIVMSGNILQEDLLQKNISFSMPYLESNIAILTLDKDNIQTSQDIIDNFSSISTVKNNYNINYQLYFPNIYLKYFDSYEDFLNQKEFSLLVAPKINLTNIATNNPIFNIVNDNILPKLEYVYLLNNKNNLKDFINSFIEIKKDKNYYDDLYKKWVLNRVDKKSKKRWSIWHNIIMN